MNRYKILKFNFVSFIWDISIRITDLMKMKRNENLKNIAPLRETLMRRNFIKYNQNQNKETLNNEFEYEQYLYLLLFYGYIY